MRNLARTSDTRPRALKLLLTAALALSLLAPQAALASHLGIDNVAGKPLSGGSVRMDQAPDIDAAAGILMSSDGQVLWSRRGDTPRAMASTTKMMTALLVLEKGGMNDWVRVSARAARTPYAIGLRSGERMKVRGLLELMLVCSSNDAAYALGEHVSGSMPAFVARMNAKAREMGLENTRFANPHGLDASGHYASAADLAKIANAAMENPEFRRVVAKRSVRLPSYKGRSARKIKATDKLLGRYRGLDGGKTGFTGDAGYSFVAQAERGGVTLTAVVLGAKSDDSRFGQTRRLFDWGFRNVQVRTIATAGEIAASLPVTNDSSTRVPVRLAESAKARVFRLGGKVTQQVELPAEVSLPILEGQPLGEIAIMQGERELARVPAVAATSTVETGKAVGMVPVNDYVDRTVVAKMVEGHAPLSGVDPAKPLVRRVKLAQGVGAPVVEGKGLGEVLFEQDGRVVLRVPVVAAEAVAEPTFMQALRIAIERRLRDAVGAPQTAQLQLIAG